jgi:hypothetical protein
MTARTGFESRIARRHRLLARAGFGRAGNFRNRGQSSFALIVTLASLLLRQQRAGRMSIRVPVRSEEHERASPMELTSAGRHFAAGTIV